MKKLFIIDGNSLINRAFYALPLLSNSGVFSNAVFGFVNCVIKLVVENKPDYFVVAFDHARKTFRNDIYDEYKAGRKETPPELKSQFPILKDILCAMNIKCMEKGGIEADDIIGSITRRSNCENVIITGDRDSLQLINENTKVWLTQRGITDIKEVTVKNIESLYSLKPSQVIDFKALAGDKSDNIPGVLGIGDKTALSLLSSYGDINGIYSNLDKLTPKLREKLIDGREDCYMSYKLATIDTGCDIEFDINDCTYDFPFNKNVRELFKKYNFNALLKRDIFYLPKDSNQIILKTKEQLKNVLNSFNGNFFAFDLKNKISFAFGDNSYVVEKEFTLFDTDPIDVSDIMSEITPVLNNPNILKITSDIKEHLHILKMDNIPNSFDIKLAGYLLAGGNKFEQELSIGEFYATYQEQLKELEKNDMLDLYFKIEHPLIFVLYSMEVLGFKIDTAELNYLADNYTKELAIIEREILDYSVNPKLNIKSSKQLSAFLFEELGLSDKGNKKHSTAVDVLNDLIDAHPVIKLILRYRKVQKLHSTYVEPYQELTQNDAIIRTIFHQMQTATGRLSSSEPNLQNIPVRDEEGKNLRKLFISRFDGGKIISADYNQIELRLLANFSNDNVLVADYRRDTDIHRYTASKIFGVPPKEVTPAQRRTAKAVNFGIIYGISSYGLSKNIGVSVKEAQEYIDIYFNKYPRVKTYLEDMIDFAKANGFVKTLYNRIRYIPELSASGMQKMFGERVAMNMPLQGSASDIIKVAMINVFNALKEKNLKSKLILQIHDELIIDTAPGEEEAVENVLTAAMENVYKGPVPLLAEIGVGTTWFDCK